MSRYETEEEQIEAFKKWWNKNGTQLLSMVLVVVVAVAGWRYWTNSQYVASANASSMYELLQSHSQNGTFGEVSREALKLMQEQPESPYAAGAALLHASFSYDKGDLDEAISNLKWVGTNSTDKALKVVAHTRLARIYADQKQFSEAESELGQLSSMTLNATEQGNVDYIAGIIALQQGEQQKAYDAFSKVVQNPNAESNLSGLAQIQLDDLAH